MKDITVQITVQEYGSYYQFNNCYLIPKELCTVIKTVEHVQELEQQIKDLQAKLNTYEIEDSVTMKHVQHEVKKLQYNEKLLIELWYERNPCHDYSQEGKDMFWKTAFMVFEDYMMLVLPNKIATNARNINFEVKELTPEPQRKSLGIYEGVEIFEGDITYYIMFKTLKILKVKSSSKTVFGETECGSKSYLTPKEANARLKEIVREKAEDYPVSITVKQWFSNNKQLIHYSIEAFEKDHNIIYLPE